MADSTPTASAKRKVMGRMDVAQSDSPSSSITPTARPRYMRGPHGASSPGFTSVTPSSGSRSAAVGSARARVDMSAFASPTMAASSTGTYSPSMSPSVSASQSRPSFATASSAGHLNRASAQSPSLRPGPFAGHVRASSTLGNASPSIKSSDSAPSSDMSQSESFNFRSPRVRSKTDDVELSAPNAFASPTVASSMTASVSARVLTPRAQPAPTHRASAPHQIAKAAASGSTPTTRASVRPPMSPQRNSKDGYAFSPRIRSRPPSPSSSSSTSAHSALHVGTPQQHQTPTQSLSAGAAETKGSDPLSTPRLLSQDRSQSVSNLSGQLHSAAAGPSIVMSSGRTHTRTQSSLSGLQRASLPTALQPSTQEAENPLSPMSPTSWTFTRPPALQQKSSFASSTTSSSTQPLLSPSLSETPAKTAAEIAEAEEARIHRKLLDLEITNKSLLAINSALEVTKLKQAREIRELKRRLRESGRSASVDPHGSDASIRDIDDDSDSDSCASSADNDNDVLLVREDLELEAAHVRCKALIDNMLLQARKSILSRHEVKETSTGGKVLHPVEVEQMRREQEEDEDQSQQLDQSSVLPTDDDTNDEYSTMTFDTSAGDLRASDVSTSWSPSASSDRSSSSTDRMLAEGNTSSSTSNLSIDHGPSDSVWIEQLLTTPKHANGGATELVPNARPTLPPLMPSQSMPGDVSID